MCIAYFPLSGIFPPHIVIPVHCGVLLLGVLFAHAFREAPIARVERLEGAMGRLFRRALTIERMVVGPER
jgi:hypothetical protein